MVIQKIMRSPYQILVIPFIKEKGKIHYALFKRKDMDVWQGIAGGGEDGEKPIETVKREAHEECSINQKSKYIRLSSLVTIPVENIKGFIWGKEIAVIPEFSFGVELSSREIKIGHEHTEYQWFGFKDAIKKLKWDSNKTALWELNYRLENSRTKDTKKNIEIIRKFF